MNPPSTPFRLASPAAASTGFISPESPREPPLAVTVPGPPARFNAAFIRVDRALAWLDGMVARAVPPEFNPLVQAGAAANLALIVAVISGVILLIWYSPSVQFAYESLEAVNGRTLGGWMRTLHRYSSDLAMLLLFVHAGRTFIARKFSGVRWLPWITGVLMLVLVWFIGWTGYWLVWDQPAQQVAISSMHLLDALPIFGEPMGRLYVADRLVPSLLFFVVFFLHMLLPLGIAIGLALHLTRVSRSRLLPGRNLAIGLTAGMMLASILVAAPLDAPAEMAVKAPGFTVDAWYLTPLALSLRFHRAGLWVAMAGGTALGLLVPWLLGARRDRAAVAAVVDPARCHSCSQCAQDCPFDAITLVPRADQSRFASQAQVNAAKCVGCGVCGGSCDSEGIYLPWFETRSVAARLEQAVRAGMDEGGSKWVAFVCGDIEGGLTTFDLERWRRRLPGYQVHAVPQASWIQPKFVERLLAAGIAGILVVRDARGEMWSRDGGRWVADRLQRIREPRFRPERAGGDRWRVLDFTGANSDEVAREAVVFMHDGPWGLAQSRPSRPATLFGLLLLGLSLGVATVAPSHLQVDNPAPEHPEFVFSFQAFGDWLEPGEVDAAAEAARPVHMRGRPTTKQERAPVTVRLSVDGVVHERSFEAKGIGKDGPAIDQWRIPLEPGERPVEVTLTTGPDSEPLRWSGSIQAEPRRLYVVTYSPQEGFRLE